jgi:hypothetical protein
MAVDSGNRIFTIDAAGVNLYLIQPNVTGPTATLYATLSGRPTGKGARAMAFGPGDLLYVILSDSVTNSLLYVVDLTVGTSYAAVGTSGGDTGVVNIQGLAFDDSGTLYGILIGNKVCTINTSSAIARLITSSSGIGRDCQALEFDASGRLLSAESNLVQVDSSGHGTVIGATGFSKIWGLAAVTEGDDVDAIAISPIKLVGGHKERFPKPQRLAAPSCSISCPPGHEYGSPNVVLQHQRRSKFAHRCQFRFARSCRNWRIRRGKACRLTARGE